MMRKILVRKHLRLGRPVRQHWSVRYDKGRYVFDTVGGRKASVSAGALEKADADTVRSLTGLARPSDRDILGRAILENKIIGPPASGKSFTISHFRDERYVPTSNDSKDIQDKAFESVKYGVLINLAGKKAPAKKVKPKFVVDTSGKYPVLVKVEE